MTQSVKPPILTEKEKAQRGALKRAAKPKLASTIVLTHGDPKNPHILMGQRAGRSDFMPSVYVFPGGRVDRADSYAPFYKDLSSRNANILEAKYTARKARAIALATIRETYEETNLMLGKSAKFKRNINNASWDAFREKNILPDLSEIDVFGRAVTPPYRHKRYDTWFFIQHLSGQRPGISDSAELVNVGWYTIEEIAELKTARVTSLMMQILKDYLKAPNRSDQILYLHMHHGKFAQDWFPTKS